MDDEVRKTALLNDLLRYCANERGGVARVQEVVTDVYDSAEFPLPSTTGWWSVDFHGAMLQRCLDIIES